MIVAKVDRSGLHMLEVFDYAFGVLLDLCKRVCILLVRDGSVDQVEWRVVNRVVVLRDLVIDFNT